MGLARIGLCIVAAGIGLFCASPSRVEGPAIATPFHVIAHRGASAYAPENTLPAFERARQLGASAVELDVQLSRDAVVVLFHDGTLDEKTQLSGPVRDHDAAALLRADIGSWFDATHPAAETRYAGTPLTTLDALFGEFGDAFHYHVEIKSQEASLPGRILEIAAAHSLLRQLTITSFHLEPLRRARGLDRDVPIAWLVKTPQGAALETQAALEAQKRLVDRAVALGFAMLAFPAAELSEDLVRHAHEQGLEIRAFRVKTPEDMERVIQLGANGMTIDWPDRLIRRLDEIRASEPPLDSTGEKPDAI